MFALALLLIALVAPATFVRTVAEGVDSPIHERLEIVARTPEELHTLWSRCGLRQPAAQVDFSQDMLVGVFIGQRPSEGYAIDVVSVAREGGSIVVRYREQHPSRPAVARTTAPFRLLAIPRDDRPVRFIREGSAAP